jgi:hypothetical protein
MIPFLGTVMQLKSFSIASPHLRQVPLYVAVVTTPKILIACNVQGASGRSQALISRLSTLLQRSSGFKFSWEARRVTI